jgi:formate/nitrite transporter FocA (FNT family)
MAKRTGGNKRADEDYDHVELTPEEGRQVRKRASVDSYVVHEVIRRQGTDELGRPALGLFFSGLAAGIAISASVLCQSLLVQVLPDAPWRPAVAALGYTIGFVIVILGRMQLFTESTLSATIPVATKPDLTNLLRLARLWSVVLIANLVGTFAIALLLSADAIGYPEHLEGMLEISRSLLDRSFFETLKGGVPAGFLLAAVAWSLPAGRGQEFLITLFLTYFIPLGGFAHVIAGSTEAWLLALNGKAGFGFAFLGFILPSLIGNVIGGTLIFALLAHAQVRPELSQG